MAKSRKRKPLLHCYKPLKLEIESMRIVYPEGSDIRTDLEARDGFLNAKKLFDRYAKQDALGRHRRMLDRAISHSRDIWNARMEATIEVRYLDLLHFLAKDTRRGIEFCDFLTAGWALNTLMHEEPQAFSSFNQIMQGIWEGHLSDFQAIPGAEGLVRFREKQLHLIQKSIHLNKALPMGIRVLPHFGFDHFVILAAKKRSDEFDNYVFSRFDETTDGEDFLQALPSIPYPPIELIEVWIKDLTTEIEAYDRDRSRSLKAVDIAAGKVDRFCNSLKAFAVVAPDESSPESKGSLALCLCNYAIVCLTEHLPYAVGQDYQVKTSTFGQSVWFIYLNNLFLKWRNGDERPTDLFKEFLLYHLTHPTWLNKAPGEDCPIPHTQWPESFIEAWTPVSISLKAYHPEHSEGRFHDCVRAASSFEELAFYLSAYLTQRFRESDACEVIGEARTKRLRDWYEKWVRRIFSESLSHAAKLDLAVAQFRWKTPEDLAWSALLEEERHEQERRAQEQQEWREQARGLALLRGVEEPIENEEEPETLYTCEYIFDVQKIGGRAELFSFTEDDLEETLEAFCRKHRISNMVPFRSIANAVMHFLGMDEASRLVMRKEKNADGVVWSKLKRDNQRIYLLSETEQKDRFKMHLMRRKDWSHLQRR